MAPAASRWPFQPFWELDGFDFGSLPIAHYDDGLREALEKEEFTTAIPANNSNPISNAEYCRRVCNNVAVQFRAMLFCKDTHPSPVFWQRVQSCSNRHNSSIPIVTAVGNIFVAARRAFRRISRSSPNEAARLVDAWISFLDSPQRAANAPDNTQAMIPWDVRYREWASIRDKGELMDVGQPPFQTFESARQSAGAPIGRGRNPSSPVIKREESENRDSGDDSVIELGSTKSDGFVSSRTRGSKRKADQNSNSRPAKRQVEASNTARNQRITETSWNGRDPGVWDRYHPYSPPPSSPLGHRGNQGGRPTPLHPASSSPAGARWVGARPPFPRNDDNRARITDHEDRFEEQNQRISRQDLRIETEAANIADNTRKIQGLDRRLRTVEERSASDEAQNRDRGNRQQDFETIQESVNELKRRLDSRNSYIRTEVRNRWAELRTPIEEGQNRAMTRLDGLRDDLAVQRDKLEKCQKDVKKHTTDIKGQVDSLKKKSRNDRKSITQLSARVEELEGKLRNNNIPVAAESESDEDSSSNDEVFDSGRTNNKSSQIEVRLTDLLKRVTKLEKKAKRQDRDGKKFRVAKQQDETMDKIMARLRTLEKGAKDAAFSEAGGRISYLILLEARLDSQEAQLARQEETIKELRRQMGREEKEEKEEKVQKAQNYPMVGTRTIKNLAWRGSRKTFD